MNRVRLELMADYFQIYVCDVDHQEDWSGAWNESTLAQRMALLPHTAVFLTGRNMCVPVEVVVLSTVPDLTALTHGADHAVAGGLACPTGVVAVAGCTDYFPDATRFTPGVGRTGYVFVSFDLASVDGHDGRDRYSLHLWLTDKTPDSQVLVQWTGNGT